MYYKVMSVTIKPEVRFKNYSSRKRTYLAMSRINNSKPFVDTKLYQKLFVLFITLSTFLIFPESPKQLEFVCTIHNSSDVCNVF